MAISKPPALPTLASRPVHEPESATTLWTGESGILVAAASVFYAWLFTRAKSS